MTSTLSQTGEYTLALVSHNVILGDGQGRINVAIAEELARRGHRLRLIASRVEPSLASHPSVTWERIDVSRWPSQLVKNQAFARHAGRVLRGDRPDVLIACGFVCQEPSDLNVVHFVHRAWWSSPVHTRRLEKGPYAWYQAAYTAANVRLEAAALQQTGAVVAVSHLVAQQVAPIVPTGTEVHVIPNGVDCTLFHPGPGDRATLGVPLDRPLALYAGDARTPRKNLDGVLKALQRVPDVHLVVAGSAAGGPFPAMAAQLGVADRVRFLGFRDDLPALMRASDFVLFPSRYDPFGLVALEAMASGRPVVTARTAGVASLVPPTAGIVIEDPEDVEALAEAIRTLAADPARREQMGAAAREVAEAHSMHVMAGQYADAVEGIAHRKRGAA